MTWRHWLVNLGNAAVSGFVVAVSTSQIFHGTWKQDLAAAGISAGASAAKWYLQHKPPGVDGE